jgi:hypothetical protein
MSRFVDDCRKEWGRLGVPEAEANEMAADLEADLTEAQADGASPENVLGNGYFDAKSFAASWALARGVVTMTPRGGHSTISVRSLVLSLGALVGAVVAGIGFLILVRPGSSAQAIAAAPLKPRFIRPAPSILVNPHRFLFAGPGTAIDTLGWALLIAGLIGLAVMLWIWRPWSGRRAKTGFDQNLGMPSFL